MSITPKGTLNDPDSSAPPPRSIGQKKAPESPVAGDCDQAALASGSGIMWVHYIVLGFSV